MMLENKSSGSDFEPRLRSCWPKFGHVVKMYNFAHLTFRHRASSV